MLLSLVPAMGVTASAAERICKARDNNEKVTIYGDYDVGGIASIAILYKHLTQMGIDTGRTLKIACKNIAFALAVKVIVLTMGALGYANMWEAVFADAGVSVIAVLNAMRALSSNK